MRKVLLQDQKNAMFHYRMKYNTEPYFALQVLIRERLIPHMASRVGIENWPKEAILKWIHEKQQSTYIRINPDWKDCDFEYEGWIK